MSSTLGLSTARVVEQSDRKSATRHVALLLITVELTMILSSQPKKERRKKKKGERRSWTEKRRRRAANRAKIRDEEERATQNHLLYKINNNKTKHGSRKNLVRDTVEDRYQLSKVAVLANAIEIKSSLRFDLYFVVVKSIAQRPNLRSRNEKSSP